MTNNNERNNTILILIGIGLFGLIIQSSKSQNNKFQTVDINVSE